MRLLIDKMIKKQDEDNVYKVELWMNGDSTETVDYDAPFSLELDTRNYDNEIFSS